MKRLTLCLLIGLCTALAALLLATPVHAQDLGPDPGAAPADPAVEPVEAPPPESLADAVPEVPEAAALIDEAVPVEIPAAETEPPAEAVDAAAVEVLTETGVTLADESGAVLPLATGGGDPYFTVGATTYRFQFPGGCAAYGGISATCTESATPIQDAITKVGTGFIPNDRTIYVEAGTYAGDVSINAAVNPVLNGLAGLVGGLNANGEPDRIINGDILVNSPDFGFTLSGFRINGNIDLVAVAGNVTLRDLKVRGNSVGDQAVVVQNSTGVVTVEAVDISQNIGPGLLVNNSASYFPVNISNSRFDENDDPMDITNYNGLEVVTKGAITVTGVSANGNGGNGAKLTSTTSMVTVRNAAMSSNNPETGNPSYGYGLWVDSFLTTTVENLVASNNARSGVRATSTNTVILTNIVAGTNGLDGVSVAKPVAETLPDDDWTLAGGMLVLLTRIDANVNGRNGILVMAGSSILAAQLNTFDNGVMGAELDNCRYSAGACLGNGTISVTSGIFNGDGGQDYGLVARARGSILVTDVIAQWNNNQGAILTNQFIGAYGAVSVQGTTASHAVFSDNGSHGLEVYSTQGITLYQVEASRNGNSGAYLVNDSAGSLGAVTVNESGFEDNQDYGLWVRSNGAILLTATWANGNGLGGSGDGAYLVNNGSAYPMPVTIITAGFWNNSNGKGLNVISKGYIYLYGVSAGNNGGFGVSLANMSGLASGVTVIGAGTSPLNPYSDLYNNSTHGMWISSNGTVMVMNLNVNENDYAGLVIDTGASVYGSATLINVFLDNNGAQGLVVSTKGPVAWTNGRANSNGHSGGYAGVEIYNDGSAYPMPVTLTNIEIRDSADTGLVVGSKGAITLGNASIENNLNSGAVLDNDAGTASMVYLYNANLNNNSYSGLEVDSRGFILLSSVWATGNQHGGMLLDNSTSAYLIGVTFSRGSTDDNLGADGLNIASKGAITLVDVGSSRNPGGHGAYLLNFGGSGSGITFIGGYYGNAFDDNRDSGMSIYSSGAVTLFNLDANNNGLNGLYVFNKVGSSGPVYIAGTLPYRMNSYSNNFSGLTVNSYSSITLFNMEASRNLLYGANLNNLDALYYMPVSITNGRFNENQNADGLQITSRGAVTLYNVDAERNSVDWNGQASLGNTYQDHLAAWDSDGDRWWFQLAVPSALTIAMDVYSGGIDPYLYLFDEYDNIVGFNDNGGGGLNALISIGLLGAGRYQIVASQTSPREDGEYLLAVNDPGKVLDRVAARNAYIRNDGWDGVSYTGAGAVSINGLYNDWGSFAHAAANGVTVITNGGLYMNYVDASSNGSIGVQVTDRSSLASSWTNVHASDNASFGIEMTTMGTTFYLYNGEFTHNGGIGLNLNSTSGTLANYSTLVNVLASDNSNDGLQITTRGPVTMINIEACANGDLGALIDTLASTTGYVNVLGQANDFSDNNGTGLTILSKGSILLVNTAANRSVTGSGASLVNNTGSGGITIQGFYAYPSWYSSFSGNHVDGLYLLSTGAISLYNVRVEGNLEDGAEMNNSSAPSYTSSISITLSQFNGNKGGDGLSAVSIGTITLSSVRADGNQNIGAVLGNVTSPGPVPQGITLTNSSFMDNVSAGLWVNTKGNILGYTVSASRNGNHGVHFDNREAGATGTISLYGSYGDNTFNQNGFNGLDIESNSTVTLYNLAAVQNVGCGADILTDAAVTVMLSRLADNHYEGVFIDAGQPVTLGYLSVIGNGRDWNDMDGIHILTSADNVSLSYSTVTGNFGNGIDAAIGAGTLTLTQVISVGNDADMDQAPDYQDNVYKH